MTKDDLLQKVDDYAFQVPYDGSNNFYNKEKHKHFRAGAEWVYDQLQKENEELKASKEELLSHFLETIRDYEHESGKSVYEDERESEEFVEIYLNTMI